MQAVKNKAIKKAPGGYEQNGTPAGADLADVQQKLKTVEGWQRDAYKRWKEYERNGQHASAAKSKQDYEHYSKCAEELRHVLNNADTHINNAVYFTKEVAHVSGIE